MNKIFKVKNNNVLVKFHFFQHSWISFTLWLLKSVPKNSNFVGALLRTDTLLLYWVEFLLAYISLILTPEHSDIGGGLMGGS